MKKNRAVATEKNNLFLMKNRNRQHWVESLASQRSHPGFQLTGFQIDFSTNHSHFFKKLKEEIAPEVTDKYQFADGDELKFLFTFGSIRIQS